MAFVQVMKNQLQSMVQIKCKVLYLSCVTVVRLVGYIYYRTPDVTLDMDICQMLDSIIILSIITSITHRGRK